MKVSADFLEAASAAGYAVKTINLLGSDWQACVKKESEPTDYASIMEPKPDGYHEEKARSYSLFMGMVADLGAKGIKGMVIDAACESTPDELLTQIALPLAVK